VYSHRKDQLKTAVLLIVPVGAVDVLVTNMSAGQAEGRVDTAKPKRIAAVCLADSLVAAVTTVVHTVAD